MQSLDLYKKRRHNIVKLGDGVSYKIPSEFTVEEVERLLELKEKEEQIKSVKVSEGTPEADANIVLFWNNVFAQLEIIFSALNDEVDEAYLRSHVTHNEALEIIGFFNEYRELTARKLTQAQPDSKKKLKK